MFNRAIKYEFQQFLVTLLTDKETDTGKNIT